MALKKMKRRQLSGIEKLRRRGNAHCILCEADPLVHAHNYQAHPLIFGDDGRPLVHVDGYTRSDGTYVGEHYRTLPDGNPYNNLSSKY